MSSPGEGERPRGTPKKKRRSYEEAARQEHNAYRLEDWLWSYRDRYPSGPQEILKVENRKLESKPPIKSANYTRLDYPPSYKSDQVLLRILVWLEEHFFDLYQALDIPFLNPDTSVSEIDRLKRWATESGERAKWAREELTRIREAKEMILWALEKVHRVNDEGKVVFGHRLAVPRSERARLKEVAVPKERRPIIIAEFHENYRACGSIPRAVARTAKSTDYRKSWIYLLTKEDRAEIKRKEREQKEEEAS